MVALTLARRLFASVLAAFVAVALLAVLLVRWSVSSPAPHAAYADEPLLDQLALRLAVRYREQGNWSFLPTGPLQRQAWLEDELARVAGADAEGARSVRMPMSAALAQRIALLDVHHALLAGAVAKPLLVAVASIDTRERALVLEGRTIGRLVLSRAENPRDDLAVAFLIEQQEALLLVVLVGLGLVTGAALLLAAHFRRPVRQLVEGARRLGAGRLGTRLAMKRSDELGELARTFDQLAAQLEQAKRSRRQWVADTSHELRTPVAVLRAQLEALHEGVRPATPENIALLLRQVSSLGKLVDDLRALAQADVRGPAMDQAEVRPWSLVCEVAEDFSGRLAQAGLSLAVGPGPEQALVRCDAHRLRQVVVNLLENCIRYTDKGGQVRIAGACRDGEFHASVDDSSPGVPPEALPRLGERFFRVDGSRSRRLGGSGLGLALCRQLMEAQGGRLAFSASPLGGLRAMLSLPLDATGR